MIKKILITGQSSYVANKLDNWLKKTSSKYIVTKESVRDDKWEDIRFSQFDVIIHVAGIAHKKESKENYFLINRDLTKNIAEKAKKQGVKQFVFISTMNVYGNKLSFIDETTPTIPNSYYGKSKLEAEQILLSLESDFFKIAIIRPPMIYGPNCIGNYTKLSNIAKVTPLFPLFENKRSMIYIDNFTEFIKMVIQNEEKGIFFPQNIEYVNTSNMVSLINKEYNKNIKMTKQFNVFIRIFANIKIIKKVFGNLIYDKKLSKYKEDYNIVSYKESITLSEKDYI